MAAIGVDDRALCWRTDALTSSFHPKGVDEFLPFDVVFFDPPYRLAANLGSDSPIDKALARLARDAVTADSALLFFRVPARTLVECPPCWQHETTYAISSMEIHVFRKTPTTLAESSAVPR